MGTETRPLIFSLLIGTLFITVEAQPVSGRDLTVSDRPVAEGPRITAYLEHQVERAWRQDDLRVAILRNVRTDADLRRLREEIRGKLLANIGGLPEARTPLNHRTVGSLSFDGFRVEKLIFESLPGFHVPALAYVPLTFSPPFPAVLVPCGHSSNGKAHYQYICQRLARRGYLALSWDPVGQGERSQFWDSAAGKSRYNLVCGEHAVLGNLAYLAGANLARWEIWDGMRALDYLLTRPDVDSSRISITGTSGGGFQASHIAALDERIGAAVPSCYISSLPMRMANRIFKDPDSDPEQDLYRMVSDGVDHAGLMLLIFPRPAMIAAAVEDFFPIEGSRKTAREIRDVYRSFGDSAKFDMIEGYHPHQFSPGNLERAFAFLDRVNGRPIQADLPPFEKVDDKVLQCTRSGQVRLDFPDGKSLTRLIREYYLQQRSSRSQDLSAMYYGYQYPGVRDWPLVRYEGVSSETQIAWESKGSSEFQGIVIERYLLHHSAKLSIPLLRLRRNQRDRPRIRLWFTLKGKLTPADWPQAAKWLDEGWEVVSFDFRGLGEDRMKYSVISVDDPALAGRSFDDYYADPISSVFANYVYNSLLVGRPYLLQMIEDAEIVVRFCREQLHAEELSAASDAEGDLLAASISQVLRNVSLTASNELRFKSWAELVDREEERWPIHYLLPDGAYARPR
jgi:hypothetical protein